MKKKITVFLILGVLLAAGWFLGLSPIIKFRNNENLVLEAAKDYFDLNASELPTGNRIKTVTLKTLYRNKFLDKDVYDPYGTKTCSVDKSWVKVKRVNDEYQYYVNLDCGIFKSSIDAAGPEIELNGDKLYKSYMVLEIGADELLKPLYEGLQQEEDLKLDYDYEKFKEEFEKEFAQQ